VPWEAFYEGFVGGDQTGLGGVIQHSFKGVTRENLATPELPGQSKPRGEKKPGGEPRGREKRAMEISQGSENKERHWQCPQI